MTAYACGDALGLPYENLPPSGVSREEIEQLTPRGGWQRGATSDDTALTVLVARHLADRGGAGDARAFLTALAVQAPSITGLGPSTSRAIEHYRFTGELPVTGGTTNGAAMRALPVGWVTPVDDPQRRRNLAIEMARATHPDPDAQCAACVVAACGSWALEGAGPGVLLEIAIEEATQASQACGATRRLGGMLEQVAEGTWRAPVQGVSLDPAETVTAALACVTHAPDLREALIQAIGFGGDTDTVAAIVGGILGAGLTRDEVLAELPWHSVVLLPDADDIAGIAAGLASARASSSS
ncbi:MAG: ADP-ribosylglycohydrolase family protein [Pseudonocardiaceae bacterium]